MSVREAEAVGTAAGRGGRSARPGSGCGKATDRSCLIRLVRSTGRCPAPLLPTRPSGGPVSERGRGGASLALSHCAGRPTCRPKPATPPARYVAIGPPNAHRPACEAFAADRLRGRGKDGSGSPDGGDPRAVGHHRPARGCWAGRRRGPLTPSPDRVSSAVVLLGAHGDPDAVAALAGPTGSRWHLLERARQ